MLAVEVQVSLRLELLELVELVEVEMEASELQTRHQEQRIREVVEEVLAVTEERLGQEVLVS